MDWAFSLFLAAGRVGRRGGRWLALGLLLLAACRPAPAPVAAPVPAPPTADHLPAAGQPGQRAFFALLRAGDSVYAQKAGYQSFAQALTYYDRAQVLAERSHDSLLLAEALFARGRFYDAWNKEPLRTIEYFQRAADLFGRLPHRRARYFYVRHLVAHAYDKVPDSLRTVQALRGLSRELAGQPDSVLRQLPFLVELPLIATEVRHYPLADSLLRRLVRRAWVRNDPETYDYLTHYYLVQSRLDVYDRHQPASRYLDSLRQQYRRTPRLLDRLYLNQNLAQLCGDAGQYQAGYAYLRAGIHLGDSLRDGGDPQALRQELIESEQRSTGRQQQLQAARARTVVLLSAALAVISLLSFYLARQGRRATGQSRRLAAANHSLGAANDSLAHVNQQLDEKVAQVELLNKEIQHRVKNNLHILFSLLRMQERRTDNPEVLEQLQAARLRVESIATLHNQLMRQPGELPLAEFLRSLVSNVVACLANDRQVMTHLQTDSVNLLPDSYFPLSLILNEWVTNSVKYADTQGQALELSIRVSRQAGHTCLRYADNGRPPAGAAGVAAPEPAAGLGTQIIGLLARQLRATLRQATPYHYELCLPDPDGADH